MRRIALPLILVLVVAACGGSSTTDSTEQESVVPAQTGESNTTDATADSDPPVTTTVPTSDGVEARTDLPPTCSLATGQEVSDLVGFSVTAEETISGGCVYDPVDDSDTSFFLNTTAFPVSTLECAGLLPTEPLFPGETVTAVTGLGSHAAQVTAEERSDFFVCEGGVLVSVELLGLAELNADDHLAVSKTIIELMLGRL